MIPNILSIAGSDPSGGAGIQADLKTISANGGYAMAALTGLTAQNTQGVTGVELVTPDFIKAQIAAIRADIRIDAIKVGMLGNAEIINSVVTALDDYEGTLVVDPVMVAKGGDRLLQADAVAALRETLIPRATIITPNLPEAADLLGMEEAQDLATMQAHAAELLKLGCGAVLLKGGHLTTEDATDILLTESGEASLTSSRIDTKNTHGTGCSLSSAVATHIALGHDLNTAVKNAKHYVSQAIAQSEQLSVGNGHGPLNHFFALGE